jgi:hypothetical protein
VGVARHLAACHRYPAAGRLLIAVAYRVPPTLTTPSLRCRPGLVARLAPAARGGLRGRDSWPDLRVGNARPP